MKKRLIIYRLYDPTYGPQGNAKTLSVILDQDNVLNYAYYGGWQDSGSSFSKSNMQLKKSLPMGVRGFKKVVLLQWFTLFLYYGHDLPVKHGNSRCA